MSPTPSSAEALTGLFPEEMAERLQISLWRARQLFQWIHRKQVFQLEDMTNIPKADRSRINEMLPVTALSPVVEQHAPKTKTRKSLFRLADGETIESVFLSQRTRITLCLSSQVGCALGCRFCATGTAGFRRNLAPAEIVEQALSMLQGRLSEKNGSPNIVFMGMGEPFQNYDAVMKSIGLLTHPDGLHIGARKITVSTVGDVPGIERFTQETRQVRLSVSLHAADDALRSQLVPLNKRYPLPVLYEALKTYQKERSRQITVEWVLLDGINDSVPQARSLAAYLKGLDAVINLIPWNAVPDLPYHSSPFTKRKQFMEALEQSGLKVTLRKEQGADIDAACGQLRAIQQK